MLTRFLLPALTVLLTLGLGVWLSQGGRPYNGLLFNVHKLVALGAVTAAGWALIRLLRGAGMPAAPLALLVGAALLAVVLFASGALMSMNKLEYAFTLSAHRAASLALVAALAAALYWLRAAL